MRWTKKPLFIGAVALVVLAVPAAAFAASHGSAPQTHGHPPARACWVVRQHAVASVLGISLQTFRQDLKAKQTLSQLVAAKDLTMSQFQKDVMAAMAKGPAMCLPPLAKKGAVSGFLRGAAAVLGMSPATLLHDVFTSGMNSVLAAHSMTSEQLIAAMATKIVASAQSHGHTLTLANVESRLTTFYDHLAGIAPAATSSTGASAG